MRLPTSRHPAHLDRDYIIRCSFTFILGTTALWHWVVCNVFFFRWQHFRVYWSRSCQCHFRLLSGDSEESVRCSYCSVLNVNDNDLRISFENTCTDSLVTAFDDEALLICDQGTEMARTKVLFIQLDQDRQTLTPHRAKPTLSFDLDCQPGNWFGKAHD